MTKQSLKIWTNVNYPDPMIELLRDGTSGHELILTSGSEDELISIGEADTVFGQPPIEAIRISSNIRWIHLDSAGYDKYDNEEIRSTLISRGAVLTTSSTVFSEPCAQHLLAMIMSLARRLPQAYASQLSNHSWPMWKLRDESSLLTGQTALLLGFGAIARRLAELLAPLRMNLIALRRRPTGDEPLRAIGAAEIKKHLPLADHVINILPANAGTRHFINSEFIAAMKPGAIFYNIGRGVTVDQDALFNALKSGDLAAAYLDVTEPEPLPPGHPLWTAPNCFITPHTAGGHIGEKERLVHHFLDNLRRFVNADDLLDRII
jgi:phosphoglycerate dehydrogenase-like enzyme